MWIELSILALTFMAAILGAFLVGFVSGLERLDQLRVRNEELVAQLTEMRQQFGGFTPQANRSNWGAFLLFILGLLFLLILVF